MAYDFVTNYDDKTDKNTLSYRDVSISKIIDTGKHHTSISEYGCTIPFLDETKILIDGLLDGHAIDVIMDTTFGKIFNRMLSWCRIICSNGGTQIKHGFIINEHGNTLTLVHIYSSITVTYNDKTVICEYSTKGFELHDMKIRNALFATVKSARH